MEAARSFAGTDQGVTGFFPVMQEFWKALGPRGDITFYDRGWYTAAMQQVLYNLFGDAFASEGPVERPRARHAGRAAASGRAGVCGLHRRFRTPAFRRRLRGGEVLRAHDEEGPEEASHAPPRRPRHALARERGKAGAHRQLRRGLRPLRPAARGQRLRIRPLDLAQRRGQAPHERRRGRDPGAGAGVRAGRPSRRRRWSCFKRLHGTVHAAFRACRRLCGLGCCARRHANRLIGRCVPARRASAPDVPVPGRARPPPPRRGGSFPGP